MYKFLDTLKKYEDVIAFRFLDEENTFEISYKQYLEDICSCAFRLESAVGNLKGKHIGIIGVNSYEYAVIMAATLFSRAVLVPINYHETDDNIKYVIDNSRLEVLIANNPKKYACDSNIKCFDFDIALNHGDGQQKDLLDFSQEEADNLLMIIYTSGTTSLSKGVCLSVHNIFHEEKILLPEKFVREYNAVPGFKAYINFPFYHIAGIIAWIACAEHGYTLIQSVKPQNILSDLIGEEISGAGVIPATLKLWLNSIRKGHIERLGGVKCIITAGAPVSAEDVKEIQSHGIAFGQYYGMTETGGNVTYNFDMEKHIASVGCAYDDVDIKIVDGEICIKSSGNMMGYYENEEETMNCLKDGMIYTGDLGYLDDDGYLYITGRKKNLIILSGGENVSPEELEKQLYKNPLIIECKVFEKNDRIYAGINSREEDQEKIRTYITELNKKMPIYKRIYKIEFQDNEFEKTASGKIKR
ncbi:long-chain acyl-CoA synthetase [Butyrivibrio sp. ob235]|nr:long-chain acyl-CoA synthetase [Butyrivibrio sp. ob235]